MQRDPRAPLFDVLQAAQLIRAFVGSKAYADYVADPLLRSGVERQFEIIGEGLNRLHRIDAALLAEIRQHRRIIDFRNLLIHGYAEIDSAVVWSVFMEKLPPLEEDVRRVLNRLDGAAP